MINFEGYSRRIDKINSVLGEYGSRALKRRSRLFPIMESMSVQSCSEFSPLLLKMQFGHTPSVLRSQSRQAQKCSRSRRVHRKGSSGVLYPRFGCGPAQSRPRPRQSRCNAAERKHKVLCISRRPRVLPLPKVQSELQKPQTRFARLRLRSSLTDSAKMPLTLSPASTASPLLKQTMITTPASFISSAKSIQQR